MLFISGNSYSQTKIGITTGVNLTSIRGNAPEDANYSSSSGLIFGLSGEFNITKSLKLVFQPEYVQRNGYVGYDVKRSPDYVDSLETNLDYIILPVILKIPALTNSTYFNGGVSFGYLTKASIKNIILNSPSKDIESSLNSFDVSFLFGFGATIHIYQNFDLDLEARYTQSVNNLGSGVNFDGNTLPTRFRSAGLQFITNILYTIK
ncbi:MAG TPA: porin family protein [Ignavibacteria bacterium]|nr:porin family protein [Ignavibacteria bacterium]